MKSIEDIVKDYTEADEERRLYMFLSHRDLRHQFFSLDKDDGDPRGRSHISAEKREAGSRLQKVTASCRGWWLRCHGLLR